MCCGKILKLNLVKIGAGSSKVGFDTDTENMVISYTYFVFNLSGEVG